MWTSLATLCYNISFNFFGLQINTGDLASSLVNIINWGFFSEGQGQNFLNFSNALQSIVNPVAGTLLCTFFLLEIFSMCTRTGDVSSITFERVTMLIAKYLFIFSVYKNMNYIMEILLTVGTSWFSSIQSSGTFSTTVTSNTASIVSNIETFMDGANILTGLMYALVFLITGAAYLGTAVGVVTGVFTRAVKIILLRGIAPIPISMFAYHETSMTAKRWLMSYVAALVEGIFIYVLIAIYAMGMNYLSGTATSFTEIVGYVIGLSVMNAVLAGGISLTSQVAHEALGG